MKRIFLLTLVLLCTASFNTIYAQGKSKKGNKNVPVQLRTKADSVSYASAKVFMRGLTDFLKQQFDINEADMAAFMNGYNDFINTKSEQYQRCYMGGQYVADMLLRRFLPNVQTDFSEQNITINRELFIQGFTDGLNNVDGPIARSAAETYINEMAKAAEAAKHQDNIRIGRDFLAENAKREGVVTTASGLQYLVLRKGNGAIPKATDEVTVKYEGRLIDGTVFDSSYGRTPDTNVFQANRLIKGWTEALTMMPVGSKWELYIPYELAYGERQAGKIPPYATLIFTLELLDIKGDTATETGATRPANTIRKPQPPTTGTANQTGTPPTEPAIHPRPAHLDPTHTR